MPSRISVLLLAAIVGLWAGITGQAAAADRPNVIVFLVDDMGPLDTSVPFMVDASGQPERFPLNDFYRTPAMERLADRGIRFSTFYAMSVCSPTRTSLLTGQNAARHRVTQWINSEGNNRGRFGPPAWRWEGVQDAAVTLPGVLRGAGYRTIFVGKAHFGPIGEPSEWPVNLGFDVSIAGCSWGQPGSYYGQDGYGAIRGNRARAVPDLEKYHGTDTFLSEALTREAEAAIDAAVAAGEPFFLDLAHYAVHAPFQSDPRFADHYADSGRSQQAQAYATLIEGMDRSLGDILDHLEALGIADETLILFLGDNGSDAPLGPAHGHTSSFPLRGKKGTHYEGGMRVPFIAAWAKPNPDRPCQQRLPIAAGAIQQQPGTVMDLYPTILALAGIEPPADHPLDGVDLAPQLAGVTNDDRPDRFLMHFPHDHRSSYFTVFRDGDWKLIYHYRPDRPDADGQRGRSELFNLASDPFEKDDLASEEPAELRRMVGEMTAALAAGQALFPVDKAGREIRPVLP